MTLLGAVAISLGLAIGAFAVTAWAGHRLERQAGIALAPLAFGVLTAASIAASTLRSLHPDAWGIAAVYWGIGFLASARVVWVMTRAGDMNRVALFVVSFWWGLCVVLAGGWVLDRLMPDGTAKTAMEWLVIGIAVAVFVGVPVVARSSCPSGDANGRSRDLSIERLPRSGE